MPRVTAAQAVAFRVAAHNLGARLPGGWLAEATTLSPLQDTAPPAGAGLSLAARVDDLVPSELERALFVNRTLVRMHSLRGVPHLVARPDGVVFGAIGSDEESLRDQLLGDWLAIESSQWTAREALAVVAGVFSATLADGEAPYGRRAVCATFAATSRRRSSRGAAHAGRITCPTSCSVWPARPGPSATAGPCATSRGW